VRPGTWRCAYLRHTGQLQRFGDRLCPRQGMQLAATCRSRSSTRRRAHRGPSVTCIDGTLAIEKVRKVTVAAEIKDETGAPCQPRTYVVIQYQRAQRALSIATPSGQFFGSSILNTRCCPYGRSGTRSL